MADITKRKKIKEAPGKDREELEQKVEELQKENRMLLDQQKAVVEEERRKLLLQLSGATAHELNQPLTSILGHVELIRLKKDYPKELDNRLKSIENAGRQMADIIKKIQTIRRDETVPYVLDTLIINLDQKINILIVEDSGSDFKKIDTIVKNQPNISISRVKGIRKTIGTLKEGQVDLVLLDCTLPDNTGFDFLKKLRQGSIDIPVIVIAGQGNETVASKLIQEGAYDYIPRQVLSKRSLSRSIVNAMEKYRLKRDVDLAMNKIAEMSTRDELTGLYNRRYCSEALEREMARAKRYHTDLSFCMIDIDHFKKIHDAYGRPAGDKVLSEIGVLLSGSIRESDIACRYGREEFAVILTNTNLDNALRLSRRFMKKLSSYAFEYGASTFKLTVSIGIASFDSSSKQSEAELVKKADVALHQAKEQGGNRIVRMS